MQPLQHFYSTMLCLFSICYNHYYACYERHLQEVWQVILNTEIRRKRMSLQGEWVWVHSNIKEFPNKIHSHCNPRQHPNYKKTPKRKRWATAESNETGQSAFKSNLKWVTAYARVTIPPLCPCTVLHRSYSDVCGAKLSLALRHFFLYFLQLAMAVMNSHCKLYSSFPIEVRLKKRGQTIAWCSIQCSVCVCV